MKFFLVFFDPVYLKKYKLYLFLYERRAYASSNAEYSTISQRFFWRA